MTKKLTRIGNNLALFIDPALLEQAGMTPESDLEIRIEGSELVISSVTPSSIDESFKTSAVRVMQKHAETFRKLSK